MKVNLLCCVAGCRNWIRIEKSSFSTAIRAGWRVNRQDWAPWQNGGQWDGYAACPNQHYTAGQVTVADLRAALKGLRGDVVISLPGGQDSQLIVVGARKARNRNL
jgi:hypothetical protein